MTACCNVISLFVDKRQQYELIRWGLAANLKNAGPRSHEDLQRRARRRQQEDTILPTSHAAISLRCTEVTVSQRLD
jgi:hypothetical protein